VLAALLLAALLALLGTAQSASAAAGTAASPSAAGTASGALGSSGGAEGDCTADSQDDEYQGELPGGKARLGHQLRARPRAAEAGVASGGYGVGLPAPRVPRPALGRIAGGLPGAPPLSLLQVFRC
jgi:hypothetical protein